MGFLASLFFWVNLSIFSQSKELHFERAEKDQVDLKKADNESQSRIKELMDATARARPDNLLMDEGDESMEEFPSDLDQDGDDGRNEREEGGSEEIPGVFDVVDDDEAESEEEEAQARPKPKGKMAGKDKRDQIKRQKQMKEDPKKKQRKEEPKKYVAPKVVPTLSNADIRDRKKKERAVAHKKKEFYSGEFVRDLEEELGDKPRKEASTIRAANNRASGLDLVKRKKNVEEENFVRLTQTKKEKKAIKVSFLVFVFGTSIECGRRETGKRKKSSDAGRKCGLQTPWQFVIGEELLKDNESVNLYKRTSQ